MKYDSSFFLRIGLAFVFIYAAVSAFLNPQAWIGFVPAFITNTITRAYFLFLHEVTNMIIGIWLLSGKKTFYAAVVSAIALAGIILVNLGSFLITFRDVGLFFAAVALAVMSKRK
jgi:hypothetical protein